MPRAIAAVLAHVQAVMEMLAVITLAALVCITAADVIGRYFLNAPLAGATELTEFGIALVVFSALPAVTWRQQHVSVDILDKLFSARLRLMRESFIHLLFTLCLFALGVRIAQLAARSAQREVVSEYLSVPLAWIQYYIAATFFITASGALLLALTTLLKPPPLKQ